MNHFALFLRAFTSSGVIFPPDTDEPIRGELFGIERLEQHAASLAAAQQVTTRSRSDRRLAKRLDDSSRVLTESYRGVEQAVREDRAITPAAEWLLDNFHIAKEQIRQIRADLPRGFYRGLPKLAGGPLAGYPRVFGLAWAFVAHTDSRLDRQMLVRFVAAYQRVQPLTIGELWAVSITLRIVLVENLRRAAERIAAARASRLEADALADQLLGVGGRPAVALEAALRRFDGSRLPTAFVVRLLQRLRDQDPRVTPALVWLDQRLAAQETTADALVREENQHQAATNVTVRNVITSMRLISTLDWTDIFESVSLVDAHLRAESSFAEMDFPTRDRYRHAIEELARGSGRTELDIVERAIDAARRSATRPASPEDDAAAGYEREPGYYLIARGRRTFEKTIGFRVPMSEWGARASTNAGIVGYVAAIGAMVAVILAVPLLAVSTYGVGRWTLVLLALLALGPASDLAVAAINRAVTHDLRPRTLPALELRDGVPSSLRTFVVVPTLLTTLPAVAEQIERLEVHSLASQDGDLRFALLSDWNDSPTETAPGDDELLAAAADGIARLNRQYQAGPDGPRFFLLHRRRMWNEGQGTWIGWERKRGKLHELNRWLRGATDTTLVAGRGELPVAPAGVRYVITLDSDTRLPRGAAKRLVGKMAHPLNRPRLDPKNGRVVQGYSVLQPRVTPSLPTRDGSLFQLVFTSPSGLDPYAFAVSDVYQDLFGEGSYSGKGIYDVDMFEAALDRRIPESTLLSHDLLEGIFARAGLVSDIELVEEFPARYDVAAARQHRWARGDWQLLPWIFGRGPTASDDHGRSAIPLVGRWKMLDNLRRTLSAPAAFLALLAGWTLPVRPAALWSAFVVATYAIPATLPVLSGIMPRRLSVSQRRHWHAVSGDCGLALCQITLLVTLIAHQCWLMSDAIFRTLFRLFIRQRRMLEWVTAAQSKVRARLDVLGSYRWMGGGIVLAAAAAVVVWRIQPGSWPVALPFLILWALSPAMARWASLPLQVIGPGAISDADARSLRLIARRTWRFFETFVTAEHHYLPPDNFQEDPKPMTAHRTSPTNMGLYLLAVVSAHDFGWLGTEDAVARIDLTLTAMQGLPCFRGHLFNWYDTHDLRPLDPKYVSAVDSGNLAGHLIALGTACREILAAPIVASTWLRGIEDGVVITRDALRLVADDRRTHTVTRRHLEDAIEELSNALSALGTDTQSAGLRELIFHADTLTDIARTLSTERADEASAEVLACAEAVSATIESHRRDLDLASAWAGLLAEPAVSEIVAVGPLAASSTTRDRAAHFDREPWQLRLATPGETADIAARSLKARLEAIIAVTQTMFEAMDFGLLFDTERQLLSIGYQVGDGRLDPSYYDLLASEARLASFVAIAKGDLPTKHWFHLGRTVAPVHGSAALISWSGSMFEYLMPLLVMRAPSGCLIDETNHTIVRRQIEYGAERGLPWGVSESAYNARDLEFTYQYSSFGVPGLGLKRGLGDDAVVAPYATALAAMIAPDRAVENFSRLAKGGASGRYGWYEALDYTPSRLPEGEEVAIVRAYMAHHQGMTVVAIANALLYGAMRSRFHAAPIVQATELLLQERTPRDVDATHPRRDEARTASESRELVPPTLRRFDSPHQSIPHTELLSNGRYAVMMTTAGSGYSRWGDLAVTRWREDATCDCWGTFIFLRDADGGRVWSAGYQPSGAEPDQYQATFFEDRVEIVRRDGTITTTLEVAVSPEDDAEARRVTIVNDGRGTREIDLTSYAEVVLSPAVSDEAHPVFSNLFVQTEFAADIGAILATRRLRSPSDPTVWAAHLAVVEGDVVGGLQFETDRARFLGRGHGIRTPISVIDGRPLSNTCGAVLDPIFSLRRRIRLEPGAVAHVTFWTLVASSRSRVLDLADSHRTPVAFERAVALAWTHAQVQLFHLGLDADEASLFQRIASHVLYANPALRPSSDALVRCEGGPPALWAHGISGDVPIVVCRIDDIQDLQIVRQLLQAHEYWRMKQLTVDLVILNEHAASYAQDLQTAIEAMVRASESPRPVDESGTRARVFVLRAELVSPTTRTLLQSVARAVFFSRRGTLFEQVKRLEEPEPVVLPVKRRVAAVKMPTGAVHRPQLEFFNGLGGFAAGGREYVTILGEGQWTPAPWINVIANPGFGFQTSVEGGGYTWAVNSQQNQVTPWANDPVSDRPGEVVYVRDEEDGTLWTPTALPIRESETPYLVRHGQGYSRFEHVAHGLSLDLLQYVPLEDPIKISRLTITNQSGRMRRLSVTAYVEWILGASRGSTAPFVVTEVDAGTRAMFARNHWSAAFGTHVAFADLGGRQVSWTGDRKEFLGRNGTLDRPAALGGAAPLSNRVGGGLDPCGALQTRIEIAPNGTTEIVFFLGETATKEEALSLIAHYRGADLDAVLGTATRAWDDVLCAVQVTTPDRAMDVLLNRWLIYQTLVCRVWARAALYQASGAYGFRDQLQDVLALVVSSPHLTRAHLLRAAARQFVEGDVQHWWLPPAGQGVRTQIADDRIWLPYVVAQYVEAAGDGAVLDEMVAFLDGPALKAGEHESFFQPTISSESGSLFEHCARALDSSLSVGSHGLPLIGTGDWNDGLSRVGIGGKGESIWLGWFLHAALSAFAPIAERRGEHARAAAWRQHAAALGLALERDGWDGGWYRRAYFDDGTPLGSRSSDECHIDAIAQSWAVMSGAGARTRAATAMAAVDELLVRRDSGLALLFTPPFDRTALDPGYIKGYPPGIRENGGQYTHGAVWSVIAFAMLGDGDKAGEAFSRLNPIRRASNRADTYRYRVEPYVACADVYAEQAHVGRGGWTWYTGSAGWMYRAGLEWILGFRLRGATLVIDPTVPKAWPRFEIVFRHHSARYEIVVDNPNGVCRGVSRVEVDGVVLEPPGTPIALVDDATTHRVGVILG